MNNLNPRVLKALDKNGQSFLPSPAWTALSTLAPLFAIRVILAGFLGSRTESGFLGWGVASILRGKSRVCRNVSGLLGGLISSCSDDDLQNDDAFTC